ncbi:MAG: hypothetical protein ACPG5B_12625 [Chitinophagales bacterium]
MKKITKHFLFFGFFYLFSIVMLAQNVKSNSKEAQALLAQQKQQLRFEANKGQLDEQVLYQAKGQQAIHFFLANEVRTMVRNNENKELLSYAMQFIDANKTPELVGKGNARNRGGQRNYINEKGAFSDVAMYKKLHYNNLWNGVHAFFHEKDGGLKYDFVVEPNADASQVRFRIKGAKNIKVNEKGELEFTTDFGTLRKGVPFTYQRSNNKTIKVTSAYIVKDDIVSFKMGNYDKSKRLIIDPVALLWSSFLGGSGNNDNAMAIHVDETTGRIYIAGHTDSSDFPSTVGQTYTGNIDAFVTCMEADGSSIVWSTLIGGSEDKDYFEDVYVNDSGDVFLSGRTLSDNFPTNGLIAPYSDIQASTGSNPILIRLSGDGSTLKYSSYFPVSSSNYHASVVVGDIIYSSTYYDNNDVINYPIPVPSSAYQNIHTGHSGQLIYAINTSVGGTAGLEYATYYGSAVDENNTLEFTDMDVDAMGNIYVGGYTYSSYDSDDILTSDAIQTYTSISNIDNHNNSMAGWVAKFDPTLSELKYATLIAPILYPNIYMEGQYFPKFDVADNGDIYHFENWAIYTESPIDFDNLVIAPNNHLKHISPLATDPDAPDDFYFNAVAKIAAANPSVYDYIATFGGTYDYDDTASGMVDSKGRAHFMYQTTYDASGVAPLATDGALQSYSASNADEFLQYVVLSPTADLEYATVLGASLDVGGLYSVPHDLYVTEECKVYMIGELDKNDLISFPVTPTYRNTDTDAQVTVYNSTPTTNDETFIAVFHDATPSSNVINDFPVDNNTFCTNALIYQGDNLPIFGESAGFESGDGSASSHNLPDIRPSPLTEAHPAPSGSGLDYIWEISTDNGANWDIIEGANLELYKPAPQGVEGTVQYRRKIIGFCYDTLSVSNVATANIAGSFDLVVNAPTDPIYYCPNNVTDLGITISGASGNISWQWYDGLTPLANDEIITPVNGTDIGEGSFSASVNLTAVNSGFYRLVVEDANGCKKEAFVTIIPKTASAFTGTIPAPICPGGTGSLTLGPIAANPLFEYSWTGPNGYTSSEVNPVVSEEGTYTLQVKLTTDAVFCVDGATSIDVLPEVPHDVSLVDIPDVGFCQPNTPATIGLSGTPPEGYVFQWAPGVNLDDATLYNPTFDPGVLPTNTTPIDEIEYTFTALRLADGCIFETKMMVTDTALAHAQAGSDKVGDGCTTGRREGIGAPETTGLFFQWTAIDTDYPSGGLAGLTASPDYYLDDVIGNQVGTNKFLTANYPLAEPLGQAYYIDFEIVGSFISLDATECFTRDTMRLFIPPCGNGDFCSDLYSNMRGVDGTCGTDITIISGANIEGLDITWTTYSIDGVVQPENTPPQGLFEVVNEQKGAAISATGPHSSEVIAHFDDATWGWPGANVVVYKFYAEGNFGTGTLDCSRQITVFSGQNAMPVVGILDAKVCTFPSPSAPLGANNTVIPYIISGIDYTEAPNSGLEWQWNEIGSGGSITADGDTPFPTLEPNVTTDYLVLVHDPITGCTAIDTMTLEVVKIRANAGTDITNVCAGSIVQIGTIGQPNYSYEWTPSAGLFFPANPPTPNPNVAQPYLSIPDAPTGAEFVVTVTELTTGCQATDTLVVTTSNDAPPLPGAGTYIGCPDGTVIIGPSSYNTLGVTYSWTAGAGADMAWLDDATLRQPIVTLPNDFTGSAIYTLTITKGTCGSVTQDYTINTVTSIDLGTDVTALCSSPHIQIGVASEADFTYLWLPTTGLYTNTTGTNAYTGTNRSQVYAAVTETTTYTLIATAPSGCSISDEIIVNAPAGVGANAGPDVFYCTNEAAISIGSSGAGTLTWTAVGYNIDPSGTPAAPTAGEEATMLGYLSSTTSAVTNFSQTTPASGIYTYRLTSDDGAGCSIFDEVNVVVRELIMDIAGGPQSVCMGDGIQLGIADIPANYTYVWSALSPASAENTINNTTAPNPIVWPTENSVYQVIYTDPFSGCTNTETVTVNLTPSPTINDVDTPTFCAPVAPQDLTTLIPDYATYFNPIWYVNNIGSVLNTPTAVSPTQTTTYFVVVENEFACTDTAQIILNVDNPQTPDILPSLTLGCSSTTVDLANYESMLSNPAYSFEWHSENNADAASLLTNTVVGTGTYYLFETTANDCVSASDMLEIQAASDITLTIDSTQCFTASNTYNVYVTTNGTITSDIGTVSVNEITDIPTGTDVTITATNANECELVETVISPDCSCPSDKCINVIVTKTN